MTLPAWPDLFGHPERSSRANIRVSLLNALFTADADKWATPAALLAELEREFRFTLDPCPLDFAPGDPDGRVISWAGHRVYCNPPYGRGVAEWLAKHREADLAVYLLPARTDTGWFHHYAPLAAEVRFLRGRLRFGSSTENAPFPSVLLIFRGGRP